MKTGCGTDGALHSIIRDVIYYVEFTPPEELLTLHVEIDKNLIEGIDDAFGMCSDAKTSCKKQFKHVEPIKWFEIDRTMSAAEVNELEMDLMPGFRINWFYGEDQDHHENLYDYDDEDGESSDFKRLYVIDCLKNKTIKTIYSILFL